MAIFWPFLAIFVQNSDFLKNWPIFGQILPKNLDFFVIFWKNEQKKSKS